MKLTRAASVLLLLFSMASVVFGFAESDWREIRTIPLPAKATVLAYSPDSERIAAGHTDGRVTVWNIKTGEMVHSLNAHSAKIKAVQFIGQGDRLLTIGDDDRARLWSTSDWKEVGTIEGVAFTGGVSPDARFLAAQDPKQAIWIWDLATLKPVRQLTEPGKGGLANIAFTADGKYIAAASLLINIDNKETVSFVGRGDKKTPLTFEQKGDKVVVSLGALQDDDAPTHRIITSSVGSLVALGRGWYGQPDFVDLWDVSVMKRIHRYKPKGAGTLTSFSFDNSLLAIEGSEKVTIWKIENGKQVAAVKGNGIMQFSPKTMELAVTDGNNLRIYVPK
jgi:Anaphase-promoting complex subunit 4 WD40 domain